MRVSRTQAEANRQNVIATASRLFRQHGFDGIGVVDLMKGAGLTQGGFYKQFASKEDLMAKATEAAVARSQAKWDKVIARADGDALEALVRFYLTKRHHDEVAAGCCLAALGAEAPRHGTEVTQALETGVRNHLDQIEHALGVAPDQDARANAMSVLATMVGALVLSRAVNDPDLSTQILDAAAKSIILEKPSANNKEQAKL